MSCSNTTARVRHFPTGRGEITLPNDVLEFALPGNPAFGALVKSIEARHGDSLVTIAMHVDEPQVHLHALFDNEGKNVKPLTEGPAAAAAAKAKGVNGRALRDAHDNVWRAVQDDFQEKVGRHVGLGRKGVKPEPRVDMTTAHRRHHGPVGTAAPRPQGAAGCAAKARHGARARACTIDSDAGGTDFGPVPLPT